MRAQELDELFKSLDTDHGGSLDINEIKVAVKKCLTEVKRVEKRQEASVATAKRLRERAAEAQAACDATLHMEELEDNWHTIEIVLGK